MIAETKSLVEVLARITRPRGWNIHAGKYDLRAHTCPTECLRGYIGKEVHVTGGRNAAQDHLGRCDLCPVTHKIGRYPFTFRGPDLVI